MLNCAVYVNVWIGLAELLETIEVMFFTFVFKI